MNYGMARNDTGDFFFCCFFNMEAKTKQYCTVNPINPSFHEKKESLHLQGGVALTLGLAFENIRLFSLCIMH